MKRLVLIALLLTCGLYATQTLNIRIKTHLALEDEQQVFTENVCKLLEYITYKGYFVTLGEVYRTHEQAMMYASTGKGIVNSLHCVRLAIDINIFDKNDKLLTTVEECRQFGEYWKSLHHLNRWGGDWTHRPDIDHYEMEEER